MICKVKSTTQETRQTNDHKWWLRTFFGHVEMGNIYEQVMFLLRGFKKYEENPSTDATASTDGGEKTKGWECNGVGKN